MTVDQMWLAIGLLGQAFFSARFIVQWVASERVKQSVIPVQFWYWSMGGESPLLAYAIYRLRSHLHPGPGRRASSCTRGTSISSIMCRAPTRARCADRSR